MFAAVTTLLAINNNGLFANHINGGWTEQPTSPKNSPPSHLFIGGLGFCGIRIAKAFREAFPGCDVSGCVRSEEKKELLSARYGDWLSVHVLDLDDSYNGLDASGRYNLASASHIVQTVAPIADYDRDPLLALHGDVINDSSSSSRLEWVGYVSSTGVYGDHDGEWVTEESELRCVDAKSVARVRAEKEWMALEKTSGGPRVDCFRCGGIYGPNRSPLFAIWRENNNASPATKGAKPKYVNRILVDDICGALLAAARSDRPRQNGRAYNLVDDDPAPRSDAVREARRLLNADDDPLPSGVVNKNAGGKRKPAVRNTGNKRCRNQRLKDEYGWKLEAPTFREGLAHLMETEM